MQIHKQIITIAVFWALTGISGANAGGVKCVTPSSPTEETICNTPDLLALDKKMQTALDEIRSELAPMLIRELERDVRQWENERNKCEADAQCIRTSYQKWFKTFEEAKNNPPQDEDAGLAQREEGTQSKGIFGKMYSWMFPGQKNKPDAENSEDENPDAEDENDQADNDATPDDQKTADNNKLTPEEKDGTDNNPEAGNNNEEQSESSQTTENKADEEKARNVESVPARKATENHTDVAENETHSGEIVQDRPEEQTRQTETTPKKSGNRLDLQKQSGQNKTKRPVVNNASVHQAQTQPALRKKTRSALRKKKRTATARLHGKYSARQKQFSGRQHSAHKAQRHKKHYTRKHTSRSDKRYATLPKATSPKRTLNAKKKSNRKNRTYSTRSQKTPHSQNKISSGKTREAMRASRRHPAQRTSTTRTAKFKSRSNYKQKHNIRLAKTPRTSPSPLRKRKISRKQARAKHFLRFPEKAIVRRKRSKRSKRTRGYSRIQKRHARVKSSSVSRQKKRTQRRYARKAVSRVKTASASRKQSARLVSSQRQKRRSRTRQTATGFQLKHHLRDYY